MTQTQTAPTEGRGSGFFKRFGTKKSRLEVPDSDIYSADQVRELHETRDINKQLQEDIASAMSTLYAILGELNSESGSVQVL